MPYSTYKNSVSYSFIGNGTNNIVPGSFVGDGKSSISSGYYSVIGGNGHIPKEESHKLVQKPRHVIIEKIFEPKYAEKYYDKIAQYMNMLRCTYSQFVENNKTY